MSDEAPEAPKHRRRTDLIGVGFVLVASGVAAYALRGKGSEVVDAAATIGPVRVVAAAVLAMAGLLATAEVWRRCLIALGASASPGAARQIFFPAQVGKYLPGSVWPFLAQARFARRHGIQASTALLSGAVFLAIHAASAAPVAALLLVGERTTISRYGWAVLCAPLALVFLHPRVLNALVRRLPRPTDAEPPRLGWAQIAHPLAWMVPAWAAYGAAAFVLVQPLTTELSRVALASTGAFALSWLVGLLFVIAPAGIGAREAVFVLAMTPAIGSVRSTSVALLLRVCHTAADLVLAVAFAQRSSPRA
ncbi:MAG: lysylphosphatidylglycerol synthase domain-containing protein [Actinomycetota bacterium]